MRRTHTTKLLALAQAQHLNWLLEHLECACRPGIDNRRAYLTAAVHAAHAAAADLYV